MIHSLTWVMAIKLALIGEFVVGSVRYLLAAFLFESIACISKRGTNHPRDIQDRTASLEDYRREFFSSVRSVTVFTIMFVPIIWLTGNDYIKIIHTYSVFELMVYVCAMLMAHDTWFYWTHRLLHTRRFFRTWHRFHHRSVTPTAFAAYAFSVKEAFIQASFFVLWQLIFPSIIPAVFIVLAISIIRNAWGHLGIELHPRWFADHPLTSWLTTTTHHNLHHSGMLTSNFGLYFTWWDRMMGTEHPRYREIFRQVTGHVSSSAMIGTNKSG